MATAPLDHVIDALRRGEVVVVPTDTVYGLATIAEAAPVRRLFDLKGRALDKPCAVLVADVDQALELSEPDDAARRLMEHFWPGQLTVVVRRRAAFDVDLGGDPSTIGLRVPDSELIATLARAVGPLATTSANRSRQPCLTSLDAIATTFGADVATALDGGVLSGLPSTVVDCTAAQVTVLREGVVDAAIVRAVASGLA